MSTAELTVSIIMLQLWDSLLQELKSHYLQKCNNSFCKRKRKEKKKSLAIKLKKDNEIENKSVVSRLAKVLKILLINTISVR